jgi:hypothetical protein
VLLLLLLVRGMYAANVPRSGGTSLGLLLPRRFRSLRPDGDGEIVDEADELPAIALEAE